MLASSVTSSVTVSWARTSVARSKPCGVCTARSRARSGRGHHRLRLARRRGRLDLLDGVGEGQRGHDGGRAVPYGLDDGVDRVDRDQRAGRVVHQHDVDAGRQRVEAEPHGLLAGLAAGDDEEVGPLGQRVRVEQRLDLGGAVGRGHHDDQGDGAGRGHRADRVDQHGGAVQRAERLGGARTEAYAPSGGRNHRGGTGRGAAGEGRESSDIGSCQVCVLGRRGYGHSRAGRDALTGPFRDIRSSQLPGPGTPSIGELPSEYARDHPGRRGIGIRVRTCRSARRQL